MGHRKLPRRLHDLLSQFHLFRRRTFRGTEQSALAPCVWIALIVNTAFFVGEIVVGAAAGSAALQADALDFFGDAANYAISLGVAGMALAWRSRTALAKGGTLIALRLLWEIGAPMMRVRTCLSFAGTAIASAAWHAFHGTLPRAEVMGADRGDRQRVDR